MKVKAFLAGLVAMAAATSAVEAATITYSLALNDNGTGSSTPGSYAVYASANTGDNAGIAAYTFAVLGLTPGDAANIKFKAPQASWWNGSNFATFRQTGFTLQLAGDGQIQQTGSQDTTASSNPPLTYNIGQVAGTLTTAGGPSGSTVLLDGSNASYSAPVLLAVGTYGTGSVPVVGPGNATSGGNVFNLAKDRTTFAATGAYVNSPVPEPASLAVLGLGAIGLMTRRRQA